MSSFINFIFSGPGMYAGLRRDHFPPVQCTAEKTTHQYSGEVGEEITQEGELGGAVRWIDGAVKYKDVTNQTRMKQHEFWSELFQNSGLVGLVGLSGGAFGSYRGVKSKDRDQSAIPWFSIAVVSGLVGLVALYRAGEAYSEQSAWNDQIGSAVRKRQLCNDHANYGFSFIKKYLLKGSIVTPEETSELWYKKIKDFKETYRVISPASHPEKTYSFYRNFVDSCPMNTESMRYAEVDLEKYDGLVRRFETIQTKFHRADGRYSTEKKDFIREACKRAKDFELCKREVLNKVCSEEGDPAKSTLLFTKFELDQAEKSKESFFESLERRRASELTSKLRNRTGIFFTDFDELHK